MGLTALTEKLIRVEIAPSGVKASVTVTPPEGLIPPRESELESAILRELEDCGVAFGIDHWAIKSLVEQQRWGARVMVAKGVEPQPGCNARVEYYFDLVKKARPKQLEGGKVDYREIGIIQTVDQGQLLARRTPAAPGVAGMSVRGDPILPRPTQEATLFAGENTYFGDAEKTELRAEAPGSVKVKRGVVHVEKTLFISGDVGFASGNLDFSGDIIIRGNVKSGFYVRSQSSIEIHGLVEDAVVVAGGNVLVKGGFEGSGRGYIQAGGDVHLKFVQNQRVEAGGTVYIGETALNAQITAEVGIQATTGKGQVIGGHLKAFDHITAKVLGNGKNTPTRVEIQSRELPQQEKAEKERVISQQQAEIQGLSRMISNWQDRTRQARGTTSDINLHVGERLQKLQGLIEDMQHNKLELHDFETRMEAGQLFGVVTVLGIAYPGTEITIGAADCKLHASFYGAIFKNIKNAILSDN